MGDKLPREQCEASFDAMKHYNMDFPGTNKKKVIARKNNEVIFNNTVTVVAGNCHIYYKVDILWEEAGCAFKEKGLRGTYGSSYYASSYDGNILTIYSDDIIIEII